MKYLLAVANAAFGEWGELILRIYLVGWVGGLGWWVGLVGWVGGLVGWVGLFGIARGNFRGAT